VPARQRVLDQGGCHRSREALAPVRFHRSDANLKARSRIVFGGTPPGNFIPNLSADPKAMLEKRGHRLPLGLQFLHEVGKILEVRFP
jgi:hypothetical protein